MPEPQFDSHRQIATPQSKPQVGGDYTYFKDDDGFYGMKSDGTEFLIGPGAGGGTDFVPVGTTGYTVTAASVGGYTVEAYVNAASNPALFASFGNPSDAFPAQVFYANPGLGWYLSDGTADPSGGVNVYLLDPATLGLLGGLGIQGGIKFIARGSGTASSVGRPDEDGTAPNLVGVSGKTTTERNALTVAATGDHYMVFDTTLGKPVWSDGAGGWVDATGASV